jgi:hypothetical protein
VASVVADGFFDDVDDPLAGKRLDPVAPPFVIETNILGID